MKIGKIKHGNLVRNEFGWFVSYSAFRSLRQLGFRSKESLNKHIELPLHPSSLHYVQNRLGEEKEQDGQLVEFIIFEDFFNKLGIDCGICLDSSNCDCKLNFGKINELVFQKEKIKTTIDYWKDRCLSAEKYISVSIIEPSNLIENIKAFDEWQKLKQQNYY